MSIGMIFFPQEDIVGCKFIPSGIYIGEVTIKGHLSGNLWNLQHNGTGLVVALAIQEF